MLVFLSDDNKILLSRRPAKGVWPGMWSLPEVSQTEDAELLLQQVTKHSNAVGSKMPEFQHTFSHYHLTIKPYCWRDLRAKHRIAGQDDFRWLPMTEMATVGLPAPVKKLLESLKA